MNKIEQEMGDVGELVARHQSNLGRFISRTEAELHRDTIAALTAQAAKLAEHVAALKSSDEHTHDLYGKLLAAEAKLAECEGLASKQALNIVMAGQRIEQLERFNLRLDARLAECERERDAALGLLNANEDHHKAATARAERLEAALRGVRPFVEAMRHYRVPQNITDTALQVMVTIGPAFTNAMNALAHYDAAITDASKGEPHSDCVEQCQRNLLSVCRQRNDALDRAERLKAALREIAKLNRSRDQLQEMARAVLADSALTPVRDAGFVMVPREPTEAMIDAGVYASERQSVSRIYRAMIEASQQGGNMEGQFK